MNTRRNAAWILEDEIANAGARPSGERVPPLGEDANLKQAPVSPPPLTDGDIISYLIQLSHAANIQSQAMMSQANLKVVPRPHQQVTNMASRLRDFTRMNLSTFCGSKVDEYPHEFIDEMSKILFAMGFSTSEMFELATYQLKDVAQAWFVQ